MKENIPDPTEIKAAIHKLEESKAKEFYNYNMDRICGILNDFVKNPEQVPISNNFHCHIYEFEKKPLITTRESMYHEELKLIIDKLKEKSYNCWQGEQPATYHHRKNNGWPKETRTVVIEFTLNEKDGKIGFLKKLFNRKSKKYSLKTWKTWTQ